MAECEKLLKMNDEELTEMLGAFSKKECVSFIMNTMKGMVNTLVKLDEKTDKLKQLDTIQNSISELNSKVESNAEKLVKHETEIDKIKLIEQRLDRLETVSGDNFEDLYKSYDYMQRYCEGVDARLRGRNLILLGVGESDNDLGTNDTERVRKVLEKTDAIPSDQLGELVVKRIGNDQNQGRDRPLHVTLEDHDKQWKILKKAKDLKNTTGFTDIYIKRDVHPTIRKELSRLRKREREENADPRNTGVTIVYDWKSRTLKRNGTIIDRFNPSFQ